MNAKYLLFIGLACILNYSPQSFAKDVLAQAICKCNGEAQCGGGKIYKKDFYTQADCKRSQKDADKLCSAEYGPVCKNMTIDGVDRKCQLHHTDKKCPK